VKKNPLLDYARYGNFAVSFGVTLVVSLLLGFWGGSWLDNRFGTSPVFLIVGILLGVFVSFKSLLTELQVLINTEDLTQENDEKDDKDKGAKKT